MSENEFKDDRLIELYRAVARESSSPAYDASILQYAQTRAQRAGIFRRFAVSVAMAATVAIVFFVLQRHRDNDRETAAARARYATREYLLTMQVGGTPALFAVRQYLLRVQSDGPSDYPAQISH